MKLEEGRYFGEGVFQKNFNGIMITQSKYEANNKIPLHYHQNLLFGYVIKGQYFEHFLSSVKHCTSGSLIVQPPGFEHSNSSMEFGTQIINIEISKIKYLESLEGRVHFNSWNQFHSVYISAAIHKIIREIHSHDSFSDIIIESLIIELVANCARSSEKCSSITPKILYIKKMLDDDFMTPYSLAQLADAVSVTQFHLAREFKRHCNCTIGEYIRSKKIENAIKLLKRKHISISEIATTCGFTDSSHFIRVFKSHTELTPSVYRNQM